MLKDCIYRVVPLTGLVGLVGLLALFAVADVQAQDEGANREFYELRIYRVFDYEKQEAMEAHLRDAYLPALARQGIEQVGVFRDYKSENEHSVFMLIPFSSMQHFTNLRDHLNADEAYAKAEAAFSDRALEDPVYDRIESRFLKSFAGIPKMELADFSKNLSPDRIYELRLYQSHTDDHARRKVKMFNEAGELQLMRDVKMAPVFFGETLIGPDVPNLVYMLSAENETAHKEHWDAFIKSPQWNAMKDLPEFKDTVSKIQSWYLKPTDFSSF